MGTFDTPKELRDFVIEAEQARDTVVRPANERRRKLAGRNWRQGGFGLETWVNSYFNLCQALVPALVNKPPVAQIHCDNPGYGGGIGLEVADALEQGLDANSQQTKVHRVYQHAVQSALFDFGCTYTGLEPVPGYEARLAPGAALLNGWKPAPMRPRTWLIQSCNAFTDPLAPPEEGLANGHVWIASKDELAGMTNPDGTPKFDPKLLEMMAVDADADDVRKKAPYGDWVKRTVKRGDVVGYTVWCRATQTEYTIAFSTRSRGVMEQQFLCEPVQSVADDPDGPYTFWGLYWLEGEPYPYPITAAIQQIVDSRDMHRKKIDDDARSALRFVAADGKKNAMKVAAAKNKRIVNWPGFQGKFAVIDLGGPQPASVEYEQKLKQEQEEMTAISANRLGQLDPDVPATAVLDASQELDARKAYAREHVRQAAAAEMRKRARLMFSRTTVQFPFSEVDDLTGQEVSARFQGGLLPEQQGLAFDDFRFECDPFMGYQSETAALARFGKLIETADAIVQRAADPRYNVPNLAEDAFAELNVRGGAKRYLHMAVVERMQLMQAAALGAAQVTGGDPAAAGGAGGAAGADPAAPAAGPVLSNGQQGAGSAPGAGDVRSVAARIGGQTRAAGSPSGMSVRVAGGAA